MNSLVLEELIEKHQELVEKVANLLADTREYIEEHGWWRGHFVGPNHEQVCVMGGMLKSQGWQTWESYPEEMAMAMSVLVEVVNEQPRKPAVLQLGFRKAPAPDRLQFSGSVDEWNDWFAEDKQEVLDTLAKTEKIVRAGYNPDA